MQQFLPDMDESRTFGDCELNRIAVSVSMSEQNFLLFFRCLVQGLPSNFEYDLCTQKRYLIIIIICPRTRLLPFSTFAMSEHHFDERFQYFMDACIPCMRKRGEKTLRKYVLSVVRSQFVGGLAKLIKEYSCMRILCELMHGIHIWELT